MKKLATIVCSLLCLALLCSCGPIDSAIDWKDDHDIKYTASTRFLYSTDEGVSWSETIRSVYAGDPYYLAVEMAVTQSKESRAQKTVDVAIEVPKTDGLTCTLNNYPGGDLLKTTEGEEATTYEFRLVAGTNPSKFRVMFECLPERPGSVSVSVTYDDKLDEAWDSTGTIKFVNSSESIEVVSSADAIDKETTDEEGTPLQQLFGFGKK